MKRVALWICGVALVVAPGIALAQHHGGGHGAGPAGAPTGAAESDDLKNFNRAVALQATPEQVAQFQQLTKSMTAARKAAQEIAQRQKADVVHGADALTNALDDAESDNARFVAGFSPAQKSGLKDLTKKLGKSNSEVTKQDKMLHDGRSAADETRIVAVAGTLDQALADFQAQQLAIANEMGIPKDGSPQ